MTPGLMNRQILQVHERAAQAPVPPDAPSAVVVGAGMGALRHSLPTEHLSPADWPAVADPAWLAPDHPRRDELAELRAALHAAGERWRGTEAELRDDRKRRATDDAYAASPRPDGDRMLAERAEAVVRREADLARACDAILGELRARSAEADELDAAARKRRAHADELRRQADAAEADAHEVESRARWLRGQRRLPHDGRGPGVPVLSWTLASRPAPELPASQRGLALIRGADRERLREQGGV